MDASPLRTMTLGNRVITGGSHAPTPSYPRPQAGPSSRRRAPAGTPQVQGLQTQDLGPGPLVALAGRRRPDHLAVRRLPAPRDAPSDETARKALLATLPDYAVLQRQLNAALAGHLPKTLRKHLQRLAIDLTLIPYHGKPFRDLNEIYRGQAKSGTSHFHAYATAYVVRKGQRYTVALTGVKKGESLKDVVQRLLRQAAACRHPAPAAPAGSRLLQRGGGPLPPGGAVSRS